MPAQPGSLLVTDFSRGWDPTHSSEQLVGANGSQADQFGAAAGAPFKSPDVHDADFWNGKLNKRNGKTFLGASIGNGPIQGIYKYIYTSVAGVFNSILVAMSQSGSYTQFYKFNGSTWTSLVLNWLNISYCYFETLKNLLFISNYAQSGY